jgi:hypothetical protein
MYYNKDILKHILLYNNSINIVNYTIISFLLSIKIKKNIVHKIAQYYQKKFINNLSGD